MTHASIVKHRTKRLASNTYSFERVACLLAEIEEILPDAPTAVRAYLDAIRQWSKSLRDEMVLKNEPLVRSVVKKMWSRLEACQISVEDANSEGVCGLIHAINLYNFSLGYAFSTYAYPWIVQKIARLCDESGIIHKPPRCTAKYQEYKERAGRTLRLVDAFPADSFGMSSESMVLDRRRNHCEIADNNMDLKQLLNHLPERERLVIELRWLWDWGLAEIGEELGRRGLGQVSKERVRQLEIRALLRLRRAAHATERVIA